jgi:hypothetical protein
MPLTDAGGLPLGVTPENTDNLPGGQELVAGYQPGAALVPSLSEPQQDPLLPGPPSPEEKFVNPVRTPSTRPNRAFPSAQGFGALAVGGRGGQVIAVTTLDDYDPVTQNPIPGSLRYALEKATGRRIVVFRVGGTIFLKRILVINGEAGSYVTIAGQTAPGDGIQVAGYGLGICTGAHDVVVRHIRVRVGVTPTDTWTDPDGSGPLPPYLDKWNTDALMVYGMDGQKVSNVIIDHCSIEWAIDENCNVWDATDRVTLQYCIFAEGSTFGHYGHPEVYPYSHSCGFLAGGATGAGSDQYLTLFSNLIMHNTTRNPQFSCNGCTVEFTNNIMYNCGSYANVVDKGSSTQTTTSASVNAIGNRYLWGPQGTSRRRLAALLTSGTTAISDASIYLRDNFDPYRTQSTMDDWEVAYDSIDPFRTTGSTGYAALIAKKRSTPWTTSGAYIPVTPVAGSTILSTLPSQVGATLPRRDSVDSRLISELQNGTGDVGFGTWDNYQGHPVLANGTPPADRDGDGMPDSWEIVMGLNPASAADGPLDPDGDGYTNIEEYLNYMAGEK